MSGLRDEIRAILREEIAVLTASANPVTAPPTRERVQISSSADLNRFAQEVLRRSAEPGFAERLARGDINFELASQAPSGGPFITSSPKAVPNVLDKAMVTERDIAALTGGTRVLRLGKSSRLTPLARDEVRRRGIRIERSET